MNNKNIVIHLNHEEVKEKFRIPKNMLKLTCFKWKVRKSSNVDLQEFC